MELSGCYTAIVTPFRDGRVDYKALGELVCRQLAAGVTGLVPVGTTGESPTLSVKEHNEVIEFVTREAAGRCQIIAGTGGNSTSEAIELSKFAASIGVTATLQVTPYYNKPTPEGLYRHFSAVAEASGIPAVLYNVPGRSGREIPVETIARLASHPLMAAVKEAGGSVDRVSQICNVCDITVLSGDDSLTLPMMAVGASGVISVASNIFPADIVELTKLALAGDFAGALAVHRRLYSLFTDLFIESNPIPVKAAMADMGLIAEEYRLPLCEMAPANRQRLRATIAKLGGH
ncbi:4-hydroxy-tetrahydrodipicolinate synthase [Oligosphaera ethanolica]|uniref:4-hydroxy-tetrahydrodipicolinate synthase n=1 Tax=Oligosphaera ethanolica TaxID=760260 RepID=A0AAE3VGU0_9BACT|nr:4-hydroxy-tetrahydrodipicolinate synthase [Oligosphaera ethanolica]MDQ0290180.1 4-hydroxy-tetrahydrodipicolinate synthase [Oligosphaera ethanolica]